MNFQGIRGVLKQNYNLKHLTWLKVGGDADIFFKPEDIEDLKTFLKENNTILSLDLTPEGNNLLVSPDTFLLDVKNFLYQIYLQRPDVFAELKLPLPRDIRLHN